MLSYLQSIGVVLLCVAVALGLTRFLNWAFEDSLRKRANSVNGWQLGILGSIYAVVLGFMLSDAWLAHQRASYDVRNEAAQALMTHRTSALMPQSCAAPMQGAAEMYVMSVLEQEWPTMERHDSAGQAAPVVRTLWYLVDRCDARGTAAARESVIRALEMLQTRRDARMEDATGQLPAIM